MLSSKSCLWEILVLSKRFCARNLDHCIINWSIKLVILLHFVQYEFDLIRFIFSCTISTVILLIHSWQRLKTIGIIFLFILNSWDTLHTVIIILKDESPITYWPILFLIRSSMLRIDLVHYSSDFLRNHLHVFIAARVFCNLILEELGCVR